MRRYELSDAVLLDRSEAAIRAERTRRETKRRRLSVKAFGHPGASIPSVRTLSYREAAEIAIRVSRGEIL